jgi:hypothetical protein
MKLIGLEYYSRLAVIWGAYYRAFREFSLFTKIYVIIGGVIFELFIIGNSGIIANGFWGRLAEVLTFNYFMLNLAIRSYNRIQFEKNNELKLDIVELAEDKKAALESERMNVDMLEVTGLPVPMALRPEESKYRKKMESIEIESRKRDKRGFAEHPHNEEKDIRKQ